MAYKFVALFAFIAVANAVAVPIHHGYAHAPAHYDQYHDAPAEYDFSYSVHDEHTGDIKSQHETRKGDAVHGSYELIDADGHKRTVEYTADDHHGFNAVVHREPTGYQVPVVAHHKVIAAPVYHHAAPAYHHAAPAYHHSAPAYHHASTYHHAAPVHHYAPVAKVAIAAPIHKVYSSAPIGHHHGHESNHVSFSAPAVNYHY